MNCGNLENLHYSVLMAVYYKEKPSFFIEACESIWHQSRLTDDFVLVCDGELTNELNAIIAEQQKVHGNRMNVIRLPEQKGLGNALQIGVVHCKNEIIMRADSDDISLPDRAIKQIRFLIDGDFDVFSSTISQFDSDPSKSIGERRLPTRHDKIVTFAKKRTPFNHPAVMFRRSKVLEAGNYQTLLFMEDWYLWIRMIQKGARCGNQSETLVLMRTDANTLKRRKNRVQYASSIWLFQYMKKTHFIGFISYFQIRFLYFLKMHSPDWLAGWFYKKLHKTAKAK